MKMPISPSPLRKGATLGIIAPAGRLSDSNDFAGGIKILQAKGYQVKYPRDLWPGQGYLADSDENRGAEFNSLLADPDVGALLCLRGGYGCLRMLDRIDIDLVTSKHKMIIGFSDITVLQNYLYQKTGLLALHGPGVISLCGVNSQALERFFQCLSGNWNEPIVCPDIEVLREGKYRSAPLVGGNLASLVSMLGTPYDFSWDEKIVFLEDVNEPIYKIDRMLTQLHLAGKFTRVAGIILGEFSGVSFTDGTQRQDYLETIWSRVLELCGDRPISVWGNFPSGHCRHNFTLPLGAITLMDGSKAKLRFPDNASHS